MEFQEIIANEQSKINAELITLSRAKKNEHVIAQDEWKCHCGKINKKYVTTCACGREYEIPVRY